MARTTPAVDQENKVACALREQMESSCILNQLGAIGLSDPQICSILDQELEQQRTTLRLIPSENYTSLPVLLTMGTWLSDKYAEGSPGKRYYGGCRNIDALEALAEERLMRLFPGFEACSVQPHCGSDANLLAYMVALTAKVEIPTLEELNRNHNTKYTLNTLPPELFEKMRTRFIGQTLLGFSCSDGGHITHGLKRNLSSRLFRAVSFSVEADDSIDYDRLEALALKEKPLLIVAGITSYPRHLHFQRLRDIADKCSAVLLADVSHIAGLVVSGLLEGPYNPLPYADILTSTTHKTLRGPRGAIILAKSPFSQFLEKACPLMMGGPLPHVMAAKAIAFQEALQPSFREYCEKVLENAQSLSERLLYHGLPLYTGGTSNHLLVLNVRKAFDLSGTQAQEALESCGLITNNNLLPGDKGIESSGIRLGTPAVTTRGLGKGEMEIIGDLIWHVLKGTHCVEGHVKVEEQTAKSVREQVNVLCSSFPLYSHISRLSPEHDR
ncbi:glycine hydroxymethyltransferase [Candidatus Similichlamydia laticola]|uniref:Serine hydroxymethyltransferase n=1 Tax=Candidatus Similichlamydia laticola TaxID=2170265 RepID=A0A369KB04_9BACT|nr:glycine hydroxymethyltransferase [Candidatus Similichlamydia laticola]RDB31789.1 Serine hydroxymethyltransferase [Candidatus Similichlamydia laticola]